MKRISEVIKELESLKEQHGDLPVVVEHSSQPYLTDEIVVMLSHALENPGGKCVDCISVF